MKRLLFLSVSLLTFFPLSSQIRINELMQGNVDDVMDDFGDFPDAWVELYNMGAEAVSLDGYRLSEHRDGHNGWMLPDLLVSPHGYQLIYCDKEGMGLHASFKLDVDKGAAVYLFSPDGLLADSAVMTDKMPAPGIAYGRHDELSDEWGYQLMPTPGAANCQQLATIILGEPVFSEYGRVLTRDTVLTVRLSLPDGVPDDALIRYTLDGSEPTAESLIYTEPLTIDQSTSLRARLFASGCLSPRSSVQSYLFLGRELTLPVVAMTTDPDYFYAQQTGIYWLNSHLNPEFGQVNATPGFDDWNDFNYAFNQRRPVQLEFFVCADSASSLNQLCETRVAGFSSREFPLKTLAIYANKRFGKKHFKHEFFPEQLPGENSFKSLMLRNAGGDFEHLYLRDAIVQSTFGHHTTIDYQAVRPAIWMLNGTYMGILNIRERSNDSYLYTHYNGLDDVDIIENWQELKNGTWDAYNQFKAYFTSEGCSAEGIGQLIDIDEFIDILIMQTYYNNLDWPANNVMLWRPRTPDARWRMIAKDLDDTMGYLGVPYSFDYLRWLADPTYDATWSWGNHPLVTGIFLSVLSVPEFLDDYLDRFMVYMGDWLNYEGTWASWGPLYDQIRVEYAYHRDLYASKTWTAYQTEMTQAQQWLKQRTDFMYERLAAHYELGRVIPMSILQQGVPQMTDDAAGAIADTLLINGVALQQASFSGATFSGRDLTLSCSNPRITWEVTPYRLGFLNMMIPLESERYDTCSLTLSSEWFALSDSVSITVSLRPEDNPEEPNGDESLATVSADPVAKPRYYDLWGRPVAPRSQNMLSTFCASFPSK